MNQISIPAPSVTITSPLTSFTDRLRSACQRHLLKLASAGLASGVLGVDSGFYPEAVAMVVFAATLTVLLASWPAVRERTHCDLAAVVRERE